VGPQQPCLQAPWSEACGCCAREGARGAGSSRREGRTRRRRYIRCCLPSAAAAGSGGAFAAPRAAVYLTCGGLRSSGGSSWACSRQTEAAEGSYGPPRGSQKPRRGAVGRRGSGAASAVHLCRAIAGSPSFTTDGSAEVPASAALTAAAAAAAAARTEHLRGPCCCRCCGQACSNAPETSTPAASAVNLPEDPLSQPALATGASTDALGPLEKTAEADDCAEGSGSDFVPRAAAGDASAAGACAASASTCEPGAESESSANTFQPCAEADVSANT
jgi:hypothetical protein